MIPDLYAVERLACIVSVLAGGSTPSGVRVHDRVTITPRVKCPDCGERDWLFKSWAEGGELVCWECMSSFRAVRQA